MTSLKSEIIEATGAKFPPGLDIPSNFPNLIATDSRSISEEQWFLPISGLNFDGHDYIKQAMAKASGFIYASRSKDKVAPELQGRGIEVDDTLRFFQTLARLWRDRMGTKLVGITGSSGKTTAKEMTAHILSQHSRTFHTSGSFNNEIGVPISLCQLKPEHKFAVIEMGARHEGDIKFLCEQANPDIAVLLNIGTAHIGEFGGAEILRRTKQEIFTSTRSDCLAIYPSDDQIAGDVAKKHHDNTLGFGVKSGDVYVDELGFESNKMKLVVNCSKGPFEVSPPGYHLAYPINFAAAISVALAFGLEKDDIIRGINSFTGIDRRYRVYDTGKTIVIDDTYNANPQSMKMGLGSISKGFPDRKKIVFLGDMLELGKSSQEEHQSVGRFCAAEVAPEVLVTIGPEGKHIAQGAIDAGFPSPKIRQFDFSDDVLPYMEELIKQGNLLYAKASNGIKLDKIIRAAMNHLNTPTD